MTNLEKKTNEEKPITEDEDILDIDDEMREEIDPEFENPTPRDEFIYRFKTIAEISNDPSLDDIDETPTLYSDKVIYVFSVLFSVIAGGILLARNLKEVDRKDGIPHVLAFSVLYTFLSSYFLYVVKIGLLGTVVLAIIGSMVLNSYYWNAYIGKGITYYRKNYQKALMIVLLILIPLFFLALWSAAITGHQPVDGLRLN